MEYRVGDRVIVDIPKHVAKENRIALKLNGTVATVTRVRLSGAYILNNEDSLGIFPTGLKPYMLIYSEV